MENIIVTMVFESKKSLTDEQKRILRGLIDDYQCAIGEAVGIDEIEWILERKKEGE